MIGIWIMLIGHYWLVKWASETNYLVSQISPGFMNLLHIKKHSVLGWERESCSSPCCSSCYTTTFILWVWDQTELLEFSLIGRLDVFLSGILSKCKSTDCSVPGVLCKREITSPHSLVCVFEKRFPVSIPMPSPPKVNRWQVVVGAIVVVQGGDGLGERKEISPGQEDC